MRQINIGRTLYACVLIAVLASCAKTNDQAESPTVGVAQNETKNASQNPDVKYSVEQLDNTKGLSNSSVNCIFQDSQNLLWIGTWDGLNRYDGNNFKIFRSEPDNKNSLSNQVVLKMGEDKNGRIWVLTMHGINRYDKKTDTFEQYYFDRKNKPPLTESEFNMALDGSKNVFCAVKDWGIGYFDGSVFKSLGNKTLSQKTVTKMAFSNDDLLLLLEDGSLHSVTFETLADGSKTIANIDIISKGVRGFEILRDEKICMVLSDGTASLFSMSGKTSKLLSVKNVENIVGQTPDGIVLSAKSGYILVSADGNEIVRPWSKFLKNQKITTLVQGNENIVWTGTDGDGVFKMFPSKKSFHLVSKSQLPELDGGIVRAFLEAGQNSFWLGTKGRGLFRISDDFYRNPEKPLSYVNFNEGNSVLNNAVFALSKGRENLVFIGTDGEGLTIYDLEKSKMISWRDVAGSKNHEYFKSVYAIYQDKNGFVWLGTNGYGMVRCRISRSGDGLAVSDFQKYNAGGENALSSNIVFSIVPGNDGQLWIGTRLGGLNLFDMKSGKFTTFKNVADNRNSLSNNDILCLVLDAKKKLWIGTSFGLNSLDKLDADGTAVFKRYTTANGLPNNTVHGIVPDQKSNLWISTNFGLSNFLVQQDKFINYSKNEGLQNNEFADGAFYDDPESGYVFMGGIKGFNYFLPQKIKESAVIPDLLIDKISGQNQAVPYYQGLVISPDSKTNPAITLKHNQNFFDIQMSALTYTNSEKCQYAYQLEGFDKNWNTIDNRKIISFTNVPRGDYALWVKWSNSDGVWTEPVRAIDLKIKPVWWQSNLAVIIYLVLGICFLLFVRSYQLKKLSLRQNILFRKNEEELHENRLAFFTNIAHEFLTPLTLIVGPIQKLSEVQNLNERNQKFVNMIQRNSSRLLFLTQQLLEFRKAEHDYLGVTVKHFDLVSLIEQIAELFDDWAFEKKIEYHLEIPSELKGWFDKDKLEKIVFNLMSNAFKYTPAGGKIWISFAIENATSGRLNITITNTGKGIPKEKLDSLFDRFFLSDLNQASDTEMFRTGIGLAYIKKLVTVLRGEIEVSSIPDEQTKFTVLLPCEKSAFEENEIDLGTSPVLISHHLKNILEEKEESPENVPEKIELLQRFENQRKTILVVEDEKEIHLFLRDLLGETYNLSTAYDGVEALQLIEKELPDLIISDVMMPNMDGVDLCKKVKTDIRTCHIPFIMLTAKDSVIHRIEGLESGANSYIPKPFYPDHLLVRVQKLLQEKDLILKHFTQDSLVEDLSVLPIDHSEKEFIRQVIDLIRRNIDSENLHSAFIEKEIGISSSQLYRKTKEIFGISPGDLIRTIRLKHAAELLRKNVLTVSEVCYKSGFNNRSYFYREFNKMYQTTPKSYQLQYKTRALSFSNN
ncbi:two-component regulator propeller domain-containing protein [Flavobacterium sp.]|uniref:hybrid sensor histidine kinase/response regulator transcription factor n=1 Tax=Flavobacterium sp. TaxID=239 RepID=UPI0025C70D2D|nr:two-component regulator propeller domain-containing protein [Flavobacterium sp.]